MLWKGHAQRKPADDRIKNGILSCRLRHENIVQLYDTYDEKQYVYLVMELVTGEN